jgi:hypothetical protein
MSFLAQQSGNIALDMALKPIVVRGMRAILKNAEGILIRRRHEIGDDGPI